MRRPEIKWKTAAVVLVIVTVVAVALYIMFNSLGLQDGLDFGAGAYYYADIPEFDKYVRDDAYHSTLPLPLAVILFLAWGILMYKLWTWVDKK